MEYHGVQLEQTVTDVPYGKPAIIKFSVPEKTQLEAKNGTLLTTEYLIQEAKKCYINLACGEFNDEEEFVQEIKNNTSTYMKFFVKVRKGETWTAEMGTVRVNEIVSTFSEYKEV